MKSIRMFVAGLIVGALLATAGSALAASETVQATVAKFRFLVNGEERELRTDPIVVKGTTYLPVREVANMLGYDVTYRADSKTIEFLGPTNNAQKGVSKMPNTNTIVDAGWISLRDLAEQHNLEVRQITLDGKTYGVFRGGGIVLSVYYDGKTSTVTASTPEGNTVRAKIQNGSTMLSLEDLEAVGIIQ